MTKKHTGKTYDDELRWVRLLTVVLGGKVAQMLQHSIEALFAADAVAASRTIEVDREVDHLEVKIDRLCVGVLARWHPVAGDLRFITSILKIVRDLERMGDLAARICGATLAMGSAVGGRRHPRLLLEMAEMVEAMLEDALGALLDSDAQRARRVIALDETLDGFCDRLLQELLQGMAQNSGTIGTAVHLQGVALNLERMGDHATNVAERVVFIAEAEDLRHRRKVPRRGRGPSGPSP